MKSVPPYSKLGRSAALMLSDQLIDFAHSMQLQEKSREPSPSLRSMLRLLCQLGTVTAAELAQREQITAQSMAKTVHRAESLGYIIRNMSDFDHRANTIELTSKGREVVQNDREDRVVWLQRQVHATLTPVETQLLSLVGELLTKITDSSKE